MPIIATAGHVDHGKSTLVQALTGTDPDRWAEEKERGLTIDLGFAWTTISGTIVGFVDVPGHERFIKNMLAGVGAVDCALLVVAADSGWMPQTEEHAAVLDLLETPRGVIALTRTDLVDAETTELATLEILEEIEGTVLSDWPVVPVSSVTGEGLDELRSHLVDQIDVDRATDGPVRMWIDRSFSIRGAGLVVTGSLARGSIRIGDEVEILPQGSVCRVRGLHRHDEPVDHVEAGERAAVNIVTDGATDIGRGQLLIAPSTLGTTRLFTAAMQPSRSFSAIPKRGAFHLHIGTADVNVSIRRIGQTDGFIINADSRVPATLGDRFILRDSGRRAVVGGGRILDPHPEDQPTARDIETLMNVVAGDAVARANALLGLRGIAHTERLIIDSDGGHPTDGLAAGPYTISPEENVSIAARMHTVVSSYHEEFPLRPGIGGGELATRLDLDETIITAIVENDPIFVMNEGTVAAADFTHAITEHDERTWEVARQELEASFAVPRMGSIDLPPELLHAILRRGDLVQVGDDLVFTKRQISDITETAKSLPPGFTVADFRDRLSMTRRQAVPTLEWLDRIGVTIRSGDGRVAR
jgi:selenocysteine-specific elongation factor